MRALISVTDKTDLIPLGTRLVALKFELVSTSGTAKAIKEAGLPCTLVEEVTGFPEMLNGRVRTLHPKIFAGIIAEQRDPEHMAKLKEYGIETFDLVIVNLYEFERRRSIENIDVGGPSMLRAAAKNFASVAVICDPKDYDPVLRELEQDGAVSEKTRFRLMVRAFEHTMNYEIAISTYMNRCLDLGTRPEQGQKH